MLDLLPRPELCIVHGDNQETDIANYLYTIDRFKDFNKGELSLNDYLESISDYMDVESYLLESYSWIYGHPFTLRI